MCVLISASADAVSEIEALKSQIEERTGRLSDIEKEIEAYKAELSKVGGEKKSLQNAIYQLELERKKVNADIAYTQNKISATDLEIGKLTFEIQNTRADIELTSAAVANIFQKMYELDQTPLIEILLQYEKLSEFWAQLDENQTMRNVMSKRIDELAHQRKILEEQQALSEAKKENLLSLKDEYTDQSQILVSNKTEKDKLLRVTKNEEAEYQKLLQEREAARASILKELRDFESKLQFILDPNTIPAPGTPVFGWPVENVVITQLFGGTEFAKQNASVYGGRAYHPGVDFGVPMGTKIFAPLSGTVRATGNTDSVPGCYSWGKWTLIDHPNGLSTLYAHQSVQSVVPGQSVSTGEIIGYSGNTGYSTGPHLHFTVYAKAGVNVRKFNEIKAVTSCGAATTPVAATEAYIDPMLYLPQ